MFLNSGLAAVGNDGFSAAVAHELHKARTHKLLAAYSGCVSPPWCGCASVGFSHATARGALVGICFLFHLFLLPSLNQLLLIAEFSSS